MDRNLPAPMTLISLLDPQKVLARAFVVVAGQDYNPVSCWLRKSRPDRPPLLYEIIFKENQPWEHWRDRVYPSFVRYLRYKSMDFESGKGVIVSFFYRDQFYLLEGSRFIDVFCEIEGVDHEAFRQRAGRWVGESDD